MPAVFLVAKQRVQNLLFKLSLNVRNLYVLRKAISFRAHSDNRGGGGLYFIFLLRDLHSGLYSPQRYTCLISFSLDATRYYSFSIFIIASLELKMLDRDCP